MNESMERVQAIDRHNRLYEDLKRTDRYCYVAAIILGIACLYWLSMPWVGLVAVSILGFGRTVYSFWRFDRSSRKTYPEYHRT